MFCQLKGDYEGLGLRGLRFWGSGLMGLASRDMGYEFFIPDI